MVPFFVSFERRRPEARELVIVGVMAALAAASRVAFAVMPYLKVITGIIMITGIAFGSQAGFLTGAIAKQTDLTTLLVRAEKINDLDTGL